MGFVSLRVGRMHVNSQSARSSETVRTIYILKHEDQSSFWRWRGSTADDTPDSGASSNRWRPLSLYAHPGFWDPYSEWMPPQYYFQPHTPGMYTNTVSFTGTAENFIVANTNEKNLVRPTDYAARDLDPLSLTPLWYTLLGCSFLSMTGFLAALFYILSEDAYPFQNRFRLFTITVPSGSFVRRLCYRFIRGKSSVCGWSLRLPGSSCIPESNVGYDGQHSFSHCN